MNIKFKRIEMQNFKSVGNLTLIDFEQLNGLNYIFGTNLDSPSSRNRLWKIQYDDRFYFICFIWKDVKKYK